MKVDMAWSKTKIWVSAYQKIGFVLRFIRSSPWLAHRLFHVKLVSTKHQHVWDGTTWVLRKALKRYVKDTYRVLELGTGHIGVLAIYCSSIRKIQVVAVDINESFLDNARRVADASSAGRIEFRQSDWFSNVNGNFDIIFSNVPYIPTDIGMGIGTLTNYREVWDGGPDGGNEVRRILRDVPTFLASGGRLLLGIAPVYLPRSAVLGLIKDRPELQLENIVTSTLSPCEVYVIRAQKDEAN
jgi:methylase of polypeptide subunit release factors